jgi:hypothetical protein
MLGMQPWDECILTMVRLDGGVVGRVMVDVVARPKMPRNTITFQYFLADLPPRTTVPATRGRHTLVRFADGIGRFMQRTIA